jgi:hypothetical protein
MNYPSTNNGRYPRNELDKKADHRESRIFFPLGEVVKRLFKWVNKKII